MSHYQQRGFGYTDCLRFAPDEIAAHDQRAGESAAADIGLEQSLLMLIARRWDEMG